MNRLSLPGFVDIQVNGGFGFDITSNPFVIWDLAARLPSTGVTAFLPTLVSTTPDVIRATDEVLAAGPPEGWVGAKPLGFHTEGPMISPDKRGAHPVSALMTVDDDLIETLLACRNLRMVTIAPELDGAEEAIRVLAGSDVIVSAGHSACSYEQGAAAFAYGASHVTHLYNGMGGLHHREPGLAAAALDSDGATVGLIADGIHVHPAMVRLAVRLLGPDRIAVVTDSVAGMAMPQGETKAGAISATVSDGESRDAEGRLAGGVKPMDEIVRFLLDQGYNTDDVGTMTSSTPARILGHDPSNDQVVIDDDGVVETRISGEVVFSR